MRMLDNTQPKQRSGVILVPDLDEDRIDWERKQKGKRRGKADAELDDDTQGHLYLRSDDPAHAKKDKARKKKRQLVYDEATGRMVVKRRRRPHRDGQEVFEEWDL